MYLHASVALVLPARDEEAALPAVLDSVPSWVDTVLVVDNGSLDGTASVAQKHGAMVVREPIHGYGRACLAGLAMLEERRPDVVVFADADGSDDVNRLGLIVGPVVEGRADLMLGRRIPTGRGAMTLPQRFGNRLATGLIRLLWNRPYRDLGPMRAISWSALQRLGMDDRGFGWTVQMQIRAITEGLHAAEVDLPYRPRLAGRSKISRTVLGTVMAGSTILAVIAKEATRGRATARGRSPSPIAASRGTR